MKTKVITLAITTLFVSLINAKELYILKSDGVIDSFDVSKGIEIEHLKIDRYENSPSDYVQIVLNTQNREYRYMIDQVALMSYTSPMFLDDAIMNDGGARIFAEALKLTKFGDCELRRYRDMTYRTPSGDSCVMGKGILYNTGAEKNEHGYCYVNRYYRYTGLIEPDSVFNKAGIITINDLKNVAKKAYGSNSYDNDYTNPENFLYKFVAYHFLPEAMKYNEFNVSEIVPGDVNAKIIMNNYRKKDPKTGEIIGVEDFFETMLPHSIMRISTSNGQIYINRKGLISELNNKVEGTRPGIEINSKSLHSSAINGFYHYINGVLLYDSDTRNVSLNTRMRIDATTLSPDFINSGGRGGENSLGNGSVLMKRGYTKNVGFSHRTKVFVRHRNAYMAYYEGDDVEVKGLFDIWFKIPPVPFDGTYEIRLGYFAMPSRGVIQVYFGEMEDENQNPDYHLSCVLEELDLRVSGDNIFNGWFNDVGDIASEDSVMRSLGYMKGPDIYMNFRYSNNCLRRIISTKDLKTDKNYFIRFRQLLDSDNAELPFDYIEVVPKSVFDGVIPEDRS